MTTKPMRKTALKIRSDSTVEGRGSDDIATEASMNYIPKIGELGASFDAFKALLENIESLVTIAVSISMAVGYWFLLMDP
ncbi:MAG: hypothetical protein ACR652_10750 [Methylocystis sp.]|uniref:hypothetical protein n=1 Tax=Methylocystis sp. TaxID=1911079 RepID=UPI003DA64892